MNHYNKLYQTNRSYESYKIKEDKKRGSQVGQQNNNLQYKHKVIPAPSINEINREKKQLLQDILLRIPIIGTSKYVNYGRKNKTTSIILCHQDKE